MGPAIITAGTEISQSYVGPFTSIGANCRISGSEIESSILLSDTSIDGVRRVEKSFIGCNAVVSGPTVVPGVYQFVLGDHSRMQIGQGVLQSPRLLYDVVTRRLRPSTDDLCYQPTIPDRTYQDITNE